MGDDYLLKRAEGTAYAHAAENDIDVDIRRQRNSRTDCLLIDYDVGDTVAGRRKRSYFVKALNRADGSMTQLSDDRIIITGWH